MEELRKFLDFRNASKYSEDAPETGAIGMRQFFVESNKKYEFTSLSGGRYLIESSDLPILRTLLSKAYNGSKGRAGLKEICECITDEPNFHFFLDIEDKEERVPGGISNIMVENIIKDTHKILLEICVSPKISDVFVARNNAYHSRKIHIVFKNLIVDKPLARYITSRLKDRTLYGIDDCIDAQATTGLRIIGAKKCPVKDINGDYILGECEDVLEWKTKKGYYIPDSYTCGLDELKPYFEKQRFNSLLPQAWSDFSIFNVENLPLLEIKKNCLFWKCEMDANRLIENPPSDYVNLCTSLLSMNDYYDLTSHLNGDYNSTWWRWVNLGRFIFNAGRIDKRFSLSFWIKLSSCEKYPEEQARIACENKWKSWEYNDDDEEFETQKQNFYYTFRKVCGDALKSILETKKSDISTLEKDFMKRIKSYYDEFNHKCLLDYYGEAITPINHYEKYVNPDIFNNSAKITLLSAIMGSGKTTALIEKFRKTNEQIIWVSARKSFTDSLISELKQIGFISYLDIKGQIFAPRVIVQYESLNRINTDYYKNFVLISDEIESVFTQVVSSTNGKNDTRNIDTFGGLLQDARKVILADAFLSKRVYDILANQFNDSIVFHKYIPAKDENKKVVVLATQKDKKGKVVATAESILFSKIAQDISNGLKLYVFMSSKKKADDLYTSIKDSCNVLLYTGDKDTKNLALGVNDLWKEPQVIISTTKITIGVDCQIRFDNKYGLLSANILSRDALQSLYRVRHLNAGGKTFVCLDGRTKKVREPCSITSLYKKLIVKNKRIKNILEEWNAPKQYSVSLEWLRNRIEISSIHEWALNISAHREMAMYLFESQGYTIEQDTDTRIFENITLVQQNILEYDTLEVISHAKYETLLAEGKKRTLTDVERVLIKKHILSLYSDQKPTVEFWRMIVEKDYILKELKSLYHLIHHSREQFIDNTVQDLTLEKGNIPKKKVFDAIISYFVDNKLKLSEFTEVSKKTLREIYNLTEDMDCMNINIKKFNDKIGDAFLADRVNAFFKSVMGLEFKKGTKEQIAEKEASGKKEIKTRARIDGKVVDITPYTLISTNNNFWGIIKHSAITKQIL